MDELKLSKEEAYTILCEGLAKAPSEHHWCVAFNMAIDSLNDDSRFVEMQKEILQKYLDSNNKDNNEHYRQGIKDCLDIINRYSI